MYMGESWTASHPHSHLLEGLYTLSPADLSAPTPGPEGRVLARHWRVGGSPRAPAHWEGWRIRLPRMMGMGRYFSKNRAKGC